MITYHYYSGIVTNRKEKIINAALELFANDGYNSTSTKKIANKAEVSEGLIFKHFNNKKGLLDAIVIDAEQRINQLFGPILLETDPTKVITHTINLPFVIDKSEYDFWKLQFKLKWEEDYYNPNKMQPLIDKLTWAFKTLKVKNPKEEALLLNQILDGIAISIIRDGAENHTAFKKFLIKKYKF